MAKDKKKKMNTTEKWAKRAKKNKTTSKDMPGSGMAKKAAKEMEARNKKIDRELKKAMGR